MNRWNRARVWVRRRLGLTTSVNVGVGRATGWAVADKAIAMTWSPIQPGDDIAVRADKLARNLDSPAGERGRHAEAGRGTVREVTDSLSERVKELGQEVADHQQENRKTATWGMRWQVRGLLITLVGAGLSLIG